jgi:U2 small nuclear ribonucleoprotein A'
MRLTAEFLLSVRGSLNALSDRECVLRGSGISAIENLAVLQDQYDHIDLTDNEVLKLGNLPRMNRLMSIFLAKNSVSRISSGLGEKVPHLKVLDLTKNQLRYLSEVRNLREFKELEHLSLCENPVIHKPNYRLFMLYCIPSLKILDFQRITAQEREDAKNLFSGSKGSEVMRAVDEEAKAVAEGHGTSDEPPVDLTAEQKAKVRAAISAAKSRIELDRIELQVQTGTFPYDDYDLDEEGASKEDPAPALATKSKSKKRKSSLTGESAGEAEIESAPVEGKSEEQSKGSETVGVAGRARSASRTSEAEVEPESTEGTGTGGEKQARSRRASSVSSQTSGVLEANDKEEKSTKRGKGKRGASIASEADADAIGAEEEKPRKKRKKSEGSSAVIEEQQDGEKKKSAAKKKNRKK